MLISLQIASRATQENPALLAEFARKCLDGIVAINRVAIRSGEVPPLYRSGVRYVEEPVGVETFRDAVMTYRLRHGDCAHLAAWRVAELQEQGTDASIRITWQPHRLGRLFHVNVRLPSGGVEDPSDILGMNGDNDSKRMIRAALAGGVVRTWERAA